jgi:hypothetical protein
MGTPMTDENRQSPTVTVSHEIERHPGPFSGPDAELARACAMAVIPWYGNDNAVTHQRIMKAGIWNDHIAVQAALAAIHNVRKAAAAADDDDNTMRDDPMFNRGVQHVVDLLAKTLAPLGNWHAGDGSEDYDCDLEETLRNILAAKGLYDKETGEFAPDTKAEQLNTLQRPEGT